MVTVNKTQLYENHIDSLIPRYPAISFLKDVFIVPENTNTWTFQGRERNDVQVLFIGKTGYGKSTAMNTIVGKSIFESSDVSACTRISQCADFYINDDKNLYLSFGDLPGIGESTERDKEYLELYRNFLAVTSVVVYFLRADQRDFTVDLQAFQTVLGQNSLRDKVVIALNSADKIEPICRSENFHPSGEQKQNLNEKCKIVSKLFEIPNDRVIPISATEQWNFDSLMDAVAKVIQRADEVMIPPWHSSEWKDVMNRFR